MKIILRRPMHCEQINTQLSDFVFKKISTSHWSLLKPGRRRDILKKIFPLTMRKPRQGNNNEAKTMTEDKQTNKSNFQISK